MSQKDVIDQLERAFAIVIARARKDQEFARQLCDALTPPAPKKPAASKSVGGAQKSKRTKALKITIPKSASQEFVEEIRDKLRPLTRSQIYALIQAQKIAPQGTSKFNKHQLIEHVIRTQRKASSASKRTFSY